MLFRYFSLLTLPLSRCFPNEKEKKTYKLLSGMVHGLAHLLKFTCFFFLLFCLRINTRCNTNNVVLVPILLFDNMWRKTCSQLEINSCQFWQTHNQAHFIKPSDQIHFEMWNATTESPLKYNYFRIE